MLCQPATVPHSIVCWDRMLVSLKSAKNASCIYRCILLHWLHVRPNSDFPKNRHFFGRFLSFYRQIFCRFFPPKFKGRFGIWHTFRCFSPFLYLSAKFRQIFRFHRIVCQIFGNVWEKIEEKKSLFFRFWRRILAENSPKNSLKSAELSQNRNSASSVANALASKIIE